MYLRLLIFCFVFMAINILKVSPGGLPTSSSLSSGDLLETSISDEIPSRELKKYYKKLEKIEKKFYKKKMQREISAEEKKEVKYYEDLLKNIQAINRD